ncbi:MAG: ArsA family ATPase [Cyanobacteriota bacterium]
MRIIIITGKGGVGKTSISAATALKASKNGLKTLVMSTDQAHSLGDSLDCLLGPEPGLVAENLYAQEVDVRKELQKNWHNIQSFICNSIQASGIKSVMAEELSVFPGLEELFSILILKELYQENAYDLVIMDCAPTASTIRQLSFPEVCNWYLNKIFPIQRTLVKVARPFVDKIYEVDLPDEGVFDNVKNLMLTLTGMKDILANSEITSIRIVTNLEKMVIKEAQRSYTYMNMYGYNIDGIFVNKIFPEIIEDRYFSRWKQLHKNYLDHIHSAFEPLPIFKANLFEEEIVGLKLLDKFGNHIFGEKNPADVFFKTKPIEVTSNNDSYILNWCIPYINKEEIDLHIKGDELILKTSRYTRNMILPNVLMGKEIKQAKFEDDKLKIVFESS